MEEEEEEEGAVRRKKKDRRSEGIIDILVFSSIWRCFAKRFTKTAIEKALRGAEAGPC